MLHAEATFCYLGGMLCSDGGCDSAITTRCCMASGKFRKLLLALFTWASLTSPMVCHKVFMTCVCPEMFYGIETRYQMPLTCSGSTAMTTPYSRGSWVPRTKTKHHQLHYSRNSTLRILQQSFAVGGSDGIDMYSVHTSRIKCLANLAIHSMRWRGRHRKTCSECAKNGVRECGRLTVKRELHGGPVFGIAWCCQPDQIGHRQHPKLKMDMYGWFPKLILRTGPY